MIVAYVTERHVDGFVEPWGFASTKRGASVIAGRKLARMVRRYGDAFPRGRIVTRGLTADEACDLLEYMALPP